MDMAGRCKVWLEISDVTEEEFEARMAEQKALEASVPKVGSDAPNFIADVLDRDHDLFGDLVLQVEYIIQTAVEAISPEVVAAGRIDQLRRNAHAIARFADTAFDHVTHAQ